jgi:ubiquinone/menaquinone biosynthesis C-methylase UbiE
MMELFELGGIAATLVAAYQGHLFQALLNDCTTPAIYAEELGLNPRATRHILDILVSLDIADCNEGRYGASAALKHLDTISPGGIAALAALWNQVPAFLLRGEYFASMDGPPASREAAYSGVVAQLGQLFTPGARQLAAHLSGQPIHILDVGAGSGIWSLAMAERSPQTRVTGLDFPHVLQAFHAQAEDMGLSHRTDTIAGDFHTVNIPPHSFDCIVLANVLHLEPPEQAAALIYRIRPGLCAGGKLVIVDMIGNGQPERERSRAIYALHLALRTEQGCAHTLSQLQQWVRRAGLIAADVIDLAMPHGLGALVASCPVEP